MTINEKLKIYPLAKYKKLDPMAIYYSPSGRLKISRWKEGCGFSQPNAIVTEDLVGVDTVIINGGGGEIYEIRKATA